MKQIGSTQVQKEISRKKPARKDVFRTAKIPGAVRVFLVLFFLTVFPACAERTDYAPFSDPGEAAFLMEETKYIIHAAGRVGEEAGTPFDGSNSMEGLRKAYDRGCRVIELDFNFTADGSLACIHDWYKQYSEAITDYVPLTLAEFLECRIYDRYTPMWLGTLAEFLREHEDLYIVTDIKDRNTDGAAAIAEACPDLMNRFIIQIYDASEYSAMRELGFEYVIYTLYRLDWAEKTDTRALRKFAASHPLIGYTFSYELCAVEGYVDGMKKTGVPLFIHTVNDPGEQQAYFDMGIDGIYTDMTEGNA